MVRKNCVKIAMVSYLNNKVTTEDLSRQMIYDNMKGVRAGDICAFIEYMVCILEVMFN
ncbi:MAG: hypothetical protein PHI90_00010 [Clostridia bacterium]|nr:hypothetical protein [Clostridia bacterium]